MSPSTDLAINLEPATQADSQWCLLQYYKELAARFDAGFDPDLKNRFDPAEMEPPYGWFVVARLDKKPVACGAVMQLSDQSCEIKRLWVASNARGMGLGTKIMDHLEDIARQAGFKKAKLDTNRTLDEAKAMYEKLGYLEIAPYNDNPYADHWFEKSL